MSARTVGELLETLAGADPRARILWCHDGPVECCEGHVHTITLTHGHDADVDVTPGGVTVTLSGGDV